MWIRMYFPCSLTQSVFNRINMYICIYIVCIYIVCMPCMKVSMAHSTDTCIHMYVCTRIHACSHTFRGYLCTLIDIHTCVCVYITYNIYIYIFMGFCRYKAVKITIFLYVYIYIYIHAYMHTYIYMYIHTHQHACIYAHSHMHTETFAAVCLHFLRP